MIPQILITEQKENSNRDLLERSASKLDFLNSCDNETCVAEVDCEYD